MNPSLRSATDPAGRPRTVRSTVARGVAAAGSALAVVLLATACTQASAAVSEQPSAVPSAPAQEAAPADVAPERTTAAEQAPAPEPSAAPSSAPAPAAPGEPTPGPVDQAEPRPVPSAGESTPQLAVTG